MLAASKRVYKGVESYCRDAGLFRQLKQSLSLSESERYEKLNISKGGLALLDAVHCVDDKKRTEAFIEEIQESVKPGEVVLEAGIGTGILSFVAAIGAKRVYGVELNKNIYHFAKKVAENLLGKKLLKEAPTFSCGDATKFIAPEKVDVIVSENLYTGMFFEKQVEIVNHLKRYLRRGGRAIPSGMKSHVVLTEVSHRDPIGTRQLFVPLEDKKLKVRVLASPVPYDTIDFLKARKGVAASMIVPVNSPGLLNSILIYSDVLMPSGRVIGRNETTFLNNDIVITLLRPVKVSRGDRLKLSIKYAYGAKPKDAIITTVIMKK